MSAADEARLILGAIAVAVQTPGSGGALGLPVLLWGPPGVGKTARINQLAEALNFRLTTVLASIRGPEDFLGLPALQTDAETGARVTIFVPPKWARDLVALNPDNLDWYTRRPLKPLAGLLSAPSSTRAPSLPPGLPGLPATARPGTKPTVTLARGLLFLDEITTAPPRVLAGLLRVIHERVVGDIDLPLSTAVLAAANPPEQAVGEAVQPLQPPLANRFIHLDWPEPSAQEWAQWIEGTAKRASGLSTADIDAALREYHLSLTLSHPAFLRVFLHVATVAKEWFTVSGGKQATSFMYVLPKGEDEAGRAWPSPRSWEIGLRGFAAAQSLGRLDIGRVLLVGAVGTHAAEAFLDHLATKALPAPQDALIAAREGTLLWLPGPDRALGSAYVERVVKWAADEAPADLAPAAWDFLALLRRYGSGGLDLVQHSLKMLDKSKIAPTKAGVALLEELNLATARLQRAVGAL